ncbi:NADP-dependent L-serine/L-allo-threonine dehydrogenase ydfG [Cryomyces antarcticus]
MYLSSNVVLITGASMGIGAAIATTLASHGAQLALFARSEDKLEELGKHIVRKAPATKTVTQAVDIQDYEAVKQAVDDVMKAMGKIDVLINNVRRPRPRRAPPPFHALPTSQIDQNHLTNTSGVLYTTHAVPNASTMPRNSGTVLNMSSTTAPEAPPFPGEVVYHASKAWLEGFSNALRNELVATDVRVLRVGFDDATYDDFVQRFDPLEAQNVADAAAYLLMQPLHISVTALDVVPAAQRSLTVFDRGWTSREHREA